MYTFGRIILFGVNNGKTSKSSKGETIFMNIKKIAAFSAAAVMAAGIWTGIPAGTESVPAAVITAEAADTKLAAPTNVKAQAGDGKVTLTWDKVKGADAYRVYIYNAETGKYKKLKTVTSNKTTVKDLKNGETYKFKVAAAVKDGKTYKSGKLSKAVSATPKSEKSADKLKMKEEKLSAKEMIGTWAYYDFLYLKPYTSGASYDPNKIQDTEGGWITSLCFADGKLMLETVDDEEEGLFSVVSEVKNNEIFDDTDEEYRNLRKYKVYSYGEDKYLFAQFTNIDKEECTYIFKYVPAVTKTRVTDIDKLDGKWTAVDFCMFDIKYQNSYDPAYTQWGADYLTASEAQIKDGKVTLKTRDGEVWLENEKLGKDTLAGTKYYVYKIDGKMYLYWQFNNDDGDKQFYVFKKN